MSHVQRFLYCNIFYELFIEEDGTYEVYIEHPDEFCIRLSANDRDSAINLATKTIDGISIDRKLEKLYLNWLNANYDQKNNRFYQNRSEL